MVREMLGLQRFELVAKPKWTLGEGGKIVAAGHYTGATFDGADTVPYNGVEQTLVYWSEKLAEKAELTIFDGDRFSYEGAVERVVALCHTIVPMTVCLYVKPEELGRRLVERGSNQNPAWMKGRTTKALRFAAVDGPVDRVLHLGTDGMYPEEIAAYVTKWVLRAKQ
jgi:hypothetical protein